MKVRSSVRACRCRKYFPGVCLKILIFLLTSVERSEISTLYIENADLVTSTQRSEVIVSISSM